MQYDFKRFTQDLGQYLHPIVGSLATSLRDAELGAWEARWLASEAKLREAHRKELETLAETFRIALEQGRADWIARTTERLANQLSEHREGSHLLSLPYSGNVPDVLAGYSGPLMRIRWQDAQPVGEGESPVPAGWVLDDNQSGTWLDWINTRSRAFG